MTQAFAKRATDLVGSCLLLVLLSPLLLLLAVAVRLDSPGPALHRRRVLGRDGKPFQALKFRTMVTDGDELISGRPELWAEHRRRTKLRDDPRITRLGRWLRRYSLDELPQLLNVLVGQMSLVGPRILSPAEVDNYGPRWHNLTRLRPGMTGLWQVSGRAELGWEDRARLDAQYLAEYSLRRDLHILLLRTPLEIIRGRGAF